MILLLHVDAEQSAVIQVLLPVVWYAGSIGRRMLLWELGMHDWISFDYWCFSGSASLFSQDPSKY